MSGAVNLWVLRNPYQSNIYWDIANTPTWSCARDATRILHRGDWAAR